jgi:hypothetical protein
MFQKNSIFFRSNENISNQNTTPQKNFIFFQQVNLG